VIVTLTPNPSLDRTLLVDALPRGQVVRSRGGRSEPSGKGVNVALALHAHGRDVLAVLPAGGPDGARMVGMLDALGLPHRVVPIAGEVRGNVSLVEPDGTVTKVNEPGPRLSADEAGRLVDAVFDPREPGVTWVAGCGSLPPGAGDAYARLTAGARRRGLRVALDTSGPALAGALRHGPDLVKPNAEELAEAAGRDLLDLGDVLDAARVLRDRGAGAVLASLGPDGAVLLDAAGARHGEAPAVRVVSTVGAGDALLAGFLAAGGAGGGPGGGSGAGGGTGADALALGLGWAAAAVRQPGTLFGHDDAGPPVTVHDRVDRRRPLSTPVRRAA
jgi:1-phosphofructokinase